VAPVTAAAETYSYADPDRRIIAARICPIGWIIGSGI
jgi:hypothetical protein